MEDSVWHICDKTRMASSRIRSSISDFDFKLPVLRETRLNSDGAISRRSSLKKEMSLSLNDLPSKASVS